MNAPPPADRSLAASRTLERVEVPELPLSGIYEYTVIAATPQGVSAIPTKAGMPPITLAKVGNPNAVPPETLGPTTALSMKGQKVLVAFINQDPTRPLVLSIAITATMLIDSTVLGGSTPGPVTLVTPIVAPLVSA